MPAQRAPNASDRPGHESSNPQQTVGIGKLRGEPPAPAAGQHLANGEERFAANAPLPFKLPLPNSKERAVPGSRTLPSDMAAGAGAAAAAAAAGDETTAIEIFKIKKLVNSLDRARG